MKYFKWSILILLIGCNQPNVSQEGSSSINIVTTTGMLYDAVINITKDKAEVKYLMGPGIDPHLYKATQGDLTKIRQARVIIYNGLMLEGKMSEIFEKVSQQKKVVAAAESLPTISLLQLSDHADSYDPHIWFDIKKWQIAIKKISAELQAIDTVNQAFYAANTTNYLQSLDSLDWYIQSRVKEVPKDQRLLITAHDAFEYFGEAYGFKVKGLQGISTVSDFGLKDITNLIDLIVNNNIKAIFIETSVSDRSINSVIEGCREKGHEVIIGGTLYSDALGQPGTIEGTYIGAFKKNIDVIVDALK